MEINKTVSNPMLVGAMQLIKADGPTPDPAHQALFMEQLDEAELLAPAEIKAEVDSEGNRIPGGKTAVRFPVLTASDGKRFFVVFTDNQTVEQARKIDGPSKLPEEFFRDTVTVRFVDAARMILTPNPDGTENPTFGIVINPFMENIVIPKTAVLAIAQKKAELALAAREKIREREEKGGKVLQFPGGSPKKD